MSMVHKATIHQHTIGELFDPEPFSWGLRGDPYLWKAMRHHFLSIPMPATANELVELIHAAFEELTGKPITTESMFYVDEYAHGGMSSGHISTDSWQVSLIPELCSRFTALDESNNQCD